MDDPPISSPPRPRRPRRAWRAARWAGLILVLACGVVIGAGAFVMERALAVPPWLEDRIEARVGDMWPDGQVALGAITFQLRRSLDVSVGIQDLSLSAPDGAPLLGLGRLDATLARRGLLRARMEPKQVSASGLFLALERGEDGRFNLAFGGDVAQSAPDFGSLMAGLDAALEAPQLATLRAVTLDAVTLEYRDRQSRQTWLVDGGRVAAERTGGALSLRGDLALLTGGAEVATLSVSASSPLGSRALSLGVTLEHLPAADLATQSPALAWLGVLRAPISGALRMDVADDGRLAPLNATLQIGQGVLQPSAAARPIPFEAARAYFTFDPRNARFDFSEVSVRSAWLSGTGTATAALDVADLDDETGARGLAGLTAQIQLDNLSANPGGFYADGPRRIDRLQADLRLDLAPFALRIGQVTARAGGMDIAGQADMGVGAEGWRVSALVQVPRADPAQILAFWPEDKVPNTRRWIAGNVVSGSFENVQAHLRAAPGAPLDLYLGASVADAEVRALRSFPLVSVAAGRLTIEDNALVMVADEARLDPGRGGVLDASGTRFHIPDTRLRPGRAEVHVATAGSIEATLALLDNPPLQIMTKAGRPPDLAEGRAVVEVDLTFPLIPRLSFEQVDFRAAGQLLEVESDGIVAGRVLAAEALQVAVDREEVHIFGRGTLSGVPFDGGWRLPLGGPPETRISEVRADITLSQASLGGFGIALPPGTLTGEADGALQVGFPPGTRPRFALTSSLDGLGVAVPPLGWSLSPAQTGTFEVAGTLGAQPAIERIALSAPGLTAAGRLTLAGQGGLARADLDRVRVGTWLDAAVTLTPRGPGRAPALRLRDGSVDLRTAPFGRRGGARGGTADDTPLALQDMSLRISDTLRLERLTGDLTAGSGVRGRFTARVNGGTPIAGRALVRDGRTGFDIDAQDAGALLRDAGLFKDMSGGRFALKLRGRPQPGSFDGELSIDQVRILNAPAAAALLNAVSVVGLLDELTGQGIYFDEIDAAFRLTPGTLTITQSSAVGPSMGLSLDGYYDLANRIIDFQGVVSPFYAVNIVGRVFARRGEGLIGISFTMQGPARAPQVSVNPLSALTPGMFREIFRRPPPTLSE